MVKLKGLNCDVIGFFGNKDKSPSPEMVTKFEQDMLTTGKKITAYKYETGHGFANPSNPSFNKEATEDAHNKAIEFLKLTGSADMFDNAISQIGMMVPEKNKEAYTKEAKGTLDGLYGEIAELYMKEFTQDEIAELVAFYKSEIGQKLSSKQTQLTQQGMMLGQNWGMELQQIAQKHSN